jgi:hypothetical protein
MDRNLDGLYHRIERNGKWVNVCFSDLSYTEREKVCEGKSDEWLKTALFHMADCLRGFGDGLDVRGELE